MKSRQKTYPKDSAWVQLTSFGQITSTEIEWNKRERKVDREWRDNQVQRVENKNRQITRNYIQKKENLQNKKKEKHHKGNGRRINRGSLGAINQYSPIWASKCCDLTSSHHTTFSRARWNIPPFALMEGCYRKIPIVERVCLSGAKKIEKMSIFCFTAISIRKSTQSLFNPCLGSCLYALFLKLWGILIICISPDHTVLSQFICIFLQNLQSLYGMQLNH